MNANLNLVLRPTTFEKISGWTTDDHQIARMTFKRSYDEMKRTAHGFKREALFGGTLENWLGIPESAFASSSPREFFEQYFVACEVNDPTRSEGLFTGYYEPEAEGSLERTDVFEVPIYSKPPELRALDTESQKSIGLSYGIMRNSKAHGFSTREEIEKGALDGRGLEIVWLKSWVDAFFIHIQGSGRIKLQDGRVMRLAYAAKNGQPYTGIGGVLLKRGVASPETMSMQVLRDWMAAHTDEARALMWNNKSFIFFRDIEVPDKNLGALGAQQVNLTPLRSLAVDRSIWIYGTPIWLNTTTPRESSGGARPFQHLMIAQDTGTAIKGYVRGDVYWGWGKEAALTAGHMKSPGQMIALLPHAVVKSLQLKS